MQKLTRRSLLAPDVYQESLARVEKLTADAKPQWGRMTAAQMLAHCAEVQEVVNGRKPLRDTPLIARLFKGMIRRMVVSEKPYPHNIRTHPQYRQDEDRDFGAEKKRLLDALAEFTAADRKRLESIPHPLFGPMTAEEKGWSMYKHLDHHLAQFGL